MLAASCAHTHQSVLVSFGDPTPISLWKPAMAVPQRKPGGNGCATCAARAVAVHASRSRTTHARRMTGSYAGGSARVNGKFRTNRAIAFAHAGARLSRPGRR